jgi:hypothetical protein
VTSSFALLCQLIDTDATAPEGHAYPTGGKLVYPDLSTISAAVTWGDTSAPGNAVTYTGNLAPGASTTVTWTISYNTATGPYQVWCSGLTATKP